MRSFRAFHLPAGEPVTRELPLADGRALVVAELDRDGSRRLVDRLEEAGAALKARPNHAVVEAIGRAADRLLDPADPLRREAESWLPLESGLSLPMARLLLDRVAADWRADPLRRLLAAELPDPAMLEQFRRGPAGDRMMALGDRFAFHLGAGNVAGVGATSMVRSLLVRTPVLLKPGRGDVVLPVLLARAIGEADPVLGEALAVAYWPGGSDPPLEDEAIRRAERVVAYGGRDTIDALRRRIPAGVPFVAYGHRISAAAIGREVLDEAGARAAAAAAARAVAAYDQRGCVSPHQIWVETGGRVDAARFAELLAGELEAVSQALPPGPLAPEVAARIQQLRAAAEMGAAVDDGRALHGSDGLAWTVILEPGRELEGGCAGRLVRVRPIADLAELPSLLDDWAGLVQSVALEADAARRAELARALARAGVTRITGLERQPWPGPWWIHDGQGPLRVLLKWSSLEDTDD